MISIFRIVASRFSAAFIGPAHKMPQAELDICIESIKSHPDHLDTASVINAYKMRGLNVVPDPFSASIPAAIEDALTKQRPLSLIRIGDGEANLLTWGAYPGTKNLDRHVVESIMSMQPDSYRIHESRIIDLQNILLNAISRADIVGVLGLWRSEHTTGKKLCKLFRQDPRGISGHWRGIDYMLRLARENRLNRKTIASAHAYFSVVEHLGSILPHARKLFVITSKHAIVKKLSEKYPGLDIECIEVGKTRTYYRQLPDQPVFLQEVYAALPRDMRGCLCLVGAGPWAEPYCTWVKQRGGVGVDIGSGFDLLDGMITRPVHKRIDKKKLAGYKL